MGKVIWTYTIRHSGTHFMFNHLGTMGFTQSGAKFLEKLRGSGLFYFIHEHIDMAHNLNLVADEPIIVTMRNPIEVYRSHMFRCRLTTNPEWYERLILRSFHDLSGIVKFYNAFTLRVDEPDQDDEVTRLSEWLGVENWKYKQQDTDLNTARKTANNMNSASQELFATPPSSIMELSEQYGY